MHKLIADFRIFGFTMSIEELNTLLGTSASKFHMKGDRISANSPRVYKESVWILEASMLADDSGVGDYFLDIADKIRPNLTKFSLLCGEYYNEFSCRIFLDGKSESSTPSLHLEKSIIEIMRLLNSEVDIDIYVK